MQKIILSLVIFIWLFVRKKEMNSISKLPYFINLTTPSLQDYVTKKRGSSLTNAVLSLSLSCYDDKWKPRANGVEGVFCYDKK